MRRAIPLVLGIAGLIVAGFALSSPAQAATTAFVAGVTAAQEVPPNGSTASGVVQVTVDDVSFQVCIDTSGVTGLSGPITADHIHQGAAGVVGGVVVNFNGVPVGCVTSDATTVGNILANPAGFYVNLHTAAQPGGEVRGQLAASSQVRDFETTTDGASVVPPSGSTGGGPATLTLDPASNQLCLDASAVAGLSGPAEDIHINQAVAGANGPEVANFGAQVIGCVIIPQAVAAAMLADPAGFYLIIDTDDFSNGEVRGQLTLVPLAPTTTTTTTTTTSTSTSTSTTTTTAPAPSGAAAAATPVRVSPRFAG